MICGININKGKKDERNIKKAIAMSTIFVLLLAQMSGTKYAKAVEINTAELSNWYVYDPVSYTHLV